MPIPNIDSNGKGKKTKQFTVTSKVVGRINTNTNNNELNAQIYTRTDSACKGLLMGCYPRNRKFITGLVETCRNKKIFFVIEDKNTVIDLAARNIFLKESELSQSLCEDTEIINLISKN